MEASEVQVTAGISIHAPAKGATEFKDMVQADIKISIHAPAKGATLFED